MSFVGTDVAVWPQVCQVEESFVSERHYTSGIGDELEERRNLVLVFSTVLGFSIILGVFTLGFSKYWAFQRSIGLFDCFGVFKLGFSIFGFFSQPGLSSRLTVLKSNFRIFCLGRETEVIFY